MYPGSNKIAEKCALLKDRQERGYAELEEDQKFTKKRRKFKSAVYSGYYYGLFAPNFVRELRAYLKWNFR